ELDDPRVAAGPLREARSDLGEELVHDVLRAQLGERLAACVQVAPLAERDHLLRERLDGLGLRLGRLDPPVGDQRAREVRVERLPVRGIAPQLLACAGVAPLATRRLAGTGPGWRASP